MRSRRCRLRQRERGISMGYNNGQRELAPALKRSRAERVRHFALFAALPVGLGALAGGVTLALPGDPGQALRDVFSAAYINGVAAITVAGVLQMWFTMGETQRADYEQARADWERARADNERAKAEAERVKREEERAEAEAQRAILEKERAKREEERAKVYEMRLLLAEERSRTAAVEAARAAVEAASATVNIIAGERGRADAAAAEERAQVEAAIAAASGDERVELQQEQAGREGRRAEYAAQVNQELLHAMRNLNESQQVLNRLLADRNNGHSRQ